MSDVLRNLIRKILSESVLEESKKNISELQKGYALLITKSPPIIDFILFDIAQNKIVGEIAIHKERNMKNFDMSTVAAEPGFGALMYEIAMTYIAPLGLTPPRDGNIKNRALGVWKKFFERSDTKKMQLKPGDADYSTSIEHLAPEKQQLIHTVFFYDFGKSKLNNLIKTMETLSPEKEQEIFDQAESYFENKYDTELAEADERKAGKCLADQFSTPYVTIYRAAALNVNEFKDMDYITLSPQFAVEHAESGHVYHEEPQHVIRALVSTKDVFDAYNPGEYFYKGQPKKGKEIYVTKGDDYEGYSKDLLNP